MDKLLFADRLALTTRKAVEFTPLYVTNVLPDTYRYLVFPNMSNDAKPRAPGSQVYPEDSLPWGQFVGPLDAQGVVDYLWRAGKVPEWIDISVYEAQAEVTVLTLCCCGHYLCDPNNGFNAMVDPQFEDHTPFAIRGPTLPRGWKSGDPKFRLEDSHFLG